MTAFEAIGWDACQAKEFDREHAYKSDTGPMLWLVTCATGPFTLEETLTIAWSLDYR